MENIFEDDPDAVDRIFNLKDWNNCERFAASHPSFLKKEIWQNVTTSIAPSQMFFKVTADASYNSIIAETSATSDTVAVDRKNAAPNGERAAYNNSKDIQRLTLPDGSTAILYPNSCIQYQRNFRLNRNIQLMYGKVVVEIARDPHHPFTVYTNATAATTCSARLVTDKTGETNVSG
ncbi:FecR family protein [Niabella pedocola]|uniref:FecR family protein n=1 Tax=Niabella pedocola TaxID=1752077 RepID=A0ABS8PVL7_9BACT|nr:FecR family protein [Niabella pedocola]MCD2425115.1 FecR family protein [Niabella pedocola]